MIYSDTSLLRVAIVFALEEGCCTQFEHSISWPHYLFLFISCLSSSSYIIRKKDSAPKVILLYRKAQTSMMAQFLTLLPYSKIVLRIYTAKTKHLGLKKKKIFLENTYSQVNRK